MDGISIVNAVASAAYHPGGPQREIPSVSFTDLTHYPLSVRKLPALVSRQESSQSVPFPAFLTARVSELMAVAATKVSCPRRKVQLANAALAGPAVDYQRTNEPPT